MARRRSHSYLSEYRERIQCVLVNTLFEFADSNTARQVQSAVSAILEGAQRRGHIERFHISFLLLDSHGIILHVRLILRDCRLQWEFKLDGRGADSFEIERENYG